MALIRKRAAKAPASKTPAKARAKTPAKARVKTPTPETSAPVPTTPDEAAKLVPTRTTTYHEDEAWI